MEEEGDDELGEQLTFDMAAPQQQQFEAWRALLAVLKPFKKEQLKLEGSSAPTLSLAVPAYNQLIGSLEVVNGTPFAEAAIAAKEKLEEYYCMTSEHYTVATVLDPRYKTWYYRKDSSAGAVPVQQIEDSVRTLLAPYLASSATPTALILAEELPDESFAGIPVGETMTDELLVYLSECAAYPTCDPLAWWGTVGSRFPALQRAARDYLAIPATSAPSERAFSKGRQTISEFRHRLDPSMIEALELLQSWYTLE